MRVVCALILEEGRVLACRRSFNKDEAGKWEFPGGKVESGERDEEALAREILEELEMQVLVGRRLCSAERGGLELIGYVCERVRDECWMCRFGRLLEPEFQLESISCGGDFRGFFTGSLSLAKSLSFP